MHIPRGLKNSNFMKLSLNSKTCLAGNLSSGPFIQSESENQTLIFSLSPPFSLGVNKLLGKTFPTGGSEAMLGTRSTQPFFHFHAVFGKNTCQIIGWRTPPPVWEILDPPL